MLKTSAGYRCHDADATTLPRKVDDLHEIAAAAEAVADDVVGKAERLGPLGLIEIAEDGEVVIAVDVAGLRAVEEFIANARAVENHGRGHVGAVTAKAVVSGGIEHWIAAAEMARAVPFQLVVEALSEGVDGSDGINRAIGPFHAEGGD